MNLIEIAREIFQEADRQGLYSLSRKDLVDFAKKGDLASRYKSPSALVKDLIKSKAVLPHGDEGMYVLGY